MISVIKNKMFDPIELKENAGLLSWDPGEIEEFHTSLGNQQTPLLRLSGLAQDLGISQLLIKDESPRFGLNAFKGLGASYAMYKQIEKNPKIKTFCTATDGNHGRAVAWMANKLGKKAIIYMPQGTVSSRVKSIEQEGAEVIVIENNYDAAVKMASGHVDEENQNSEEIIHSLIQDTAWDGYEEVPLDIMKGYWTQMHEITRQIKKEKIDIVFLQSGVGSWAASLVSYIFKYWSKPPICIGVEPYSANCLFTSIKTGQRSSVENDKTTIMAGLNCGSVSTLAWDILKKGMSGSISISDELAQAAIRLLAFPFEDDPVIVSGESGSSGLGALIGLCKSVEHKKFKEEISLNQRSNVLVINTEGDTDPLNYQRIISSTD